MTSFRFFLGNSQANKEAHLALFSMGGGHYGPPIVSSISLKRLELRASNFLTFSFCLLAIRKI